MKTQKACKMSSVEGNGFGIGGGAHVEKLNGDNYHAWKFNLRMLLIGKDLWDIVSGDEVLPEEATPAMRNAFRKRDNRALSTIGLAINSDLQIYVRGTKSSKEAWDALASHFEEKTLSKKIHYRRKLYSLRMDEGTSMVEHVNKLKTIAEHLEALDDMVSEKDLVMILISSLPEDFNNLITTLETLQEEKLTWDYVRDRVLTEFDRKESAKQQIKGPQDALLVGGSQGGGNKFSRNKSDGRTKFKCHYCKETGHFINDCEKLKKRNEEKENEEQENEDANFCRGLENCKVADNDFYPEFALHVKLRKEIERAKVDRFSSVSYTHLPLPTKA